MTKITDNISLRKYIAKRLEPDMGKTAREIALAHINILHDIADVCGLSAETINRGGVINAGRYALIQAAIDDGRLPV